MAQNDPLIAQYPKQQVVMDRNYSALLEWAGSIVAQEIPSSPDDEWIRERIVATNIANQPQAYVSQTMGYFVQDPATVTNIRQFLSQWNSEEVEVALSQQNASIITAFMPRFAGATISDAQVDAWRAANLPSM